MKLQFPLFRNVILMDTIISESGCPMEEPLAIDNKMRLYYFMALALNLNRQKK